MRLNVHEIILKYIWFVQRSIYSGCKNWILKKYNPHVWTRPQLYICLLPANLQQVPLTVLILFFFFFFLEIYYSQHVATRESNLNNSVLLLRPRSLFFHLLLDPVRLFQGAEDAVGGQHTWGAAGLPPAVRQPLRVGGVVRLRAQLQHLLPQQEGPAAALAAVPERWVRRRTDRHEVLLKQSQMQGCGFKRL